MTREEASAPSETQAQLHAATEITSSNTTLKKGTKVKKQEKASEKGTQYGKTNTGQKRRRVSSVNSFGNAGEVTASLFTQKASMKTPTEKPSGSEITEHGNSSNEGAKGMSKSPTSYRKQRKREHIILWQ